MAWIQEINFRSTTGYRSDDSADAHVEDSTSNNYPEVSSQGNNVGWESSMDVAENHHNSGSGVDVRLAGAHREDTSSTINDYRIDLNATGSHDIRIAAGDHTYTDTQKVEMFDTSTSRGVLCNQSVSQDQAADAQDVEYSEANWPGSNSPATVTFTTTICRFRMGTGSSAHSIMHVSVEANLAREVKAYRFYEDGTESGSTAIAAQDTNITRSKGSTFQLRVGMQATADPPTEQAKLQHRRKSTSNAWIDVKDA